MSQAVKFGIFVIFSILLVAGFYLIDFNEKQNQLSAKNAELESVKEEIKQLKEDLAQLDSLLKEEKEWEEKIKNEINNTTIVEEDPELFVANYIKDFERAVVQQSEEMNDPYFRINSITPGEMSASGGKKKKKKKGDGEDEEDSGDDESLGEAPEALSSIPTRVFQMQLTGRYSTFIDFLYKLGELELERLVTINEISISPGDEDGTPIVKISIPVKAYLKTTGT